MISNRVVMTFVVIGFAFVGSSFGDVLTVTVTTDSNDGVCDAHCSLREAVLAANVDSNRDTVVIPPGTYVLSISGTQEDLGETGDLDLVNDVDIIGAGPKLTFIDANGIDRVIDIHGNSHSYLIRGVTLRGGGHVDQGGQGGGGCWLKGENSVTMESVHLVNNNVGPGGAGNGGGLLQTGGALTMRDCVVSNNTASNGGGMAIIGAEAASISGCTISLKPRRFPNRRDLRLSHRDLRRELHSCLQHRFQRDRGRHLQQRGVCVSRKLHVEQEPA